MLAKEWLEERILNGLAKSVYELKEYSIVVGVTCVKNTYGIS